MTLMSEIVLEESIWGRELNSSFEDVKGSFGDVGKLAPALTKKNVDFHLNTLTKGYYTKYTDTQSAFAYCGAKLHEIWWAQFNGDKGDADKVIKELGYESSSVLIDLVFEVASDIQGNGWVVVTQDTITSCTNHSWEAFDDVVILIDMWEHSYQSDYGSDKKEYISALINNALSWEAISKRLRTSSFCPF